MKNALGLPVSPVLLLRTLLLSSILCLLAACDGNYLVWSSDGKLAAAVGAKGLRVCDGEGNISKVLFEQAGIFRWLPQEHQGLVVGYEYAGSWNAVKNLLSAAQQKKVQEEAQLLKRKILNYRGDRRKFGETNLRSFKYPLEAVLYLQATAGPEFDRVANSKWPAFSAVKVPVYFIKHLQLDEKSARLLRLVNKGIDEILEIRVAPNGKYIAIVKHENGQERNYIEVQSLLAFSKAQLVAENTNAFPDWSLDSKQVYFSGANSTGNSAILKDSNLREGSLYKVEAVDASGKINAQPKAQKLASLIFDNRSPVRVMKDGRVLFLSKELRIPQSASAAASSALFSLAGSRLDIVCRKSDDLVYFEASPEQDQIAATTAGGALYLCSADGNESAELCNGKELRVSGLLPQWRTNTELSFGTEQSTDRGSKPNYAVQIWSKNGTRNLSRNWGKEALSEIVVHRDLFQEAMQGILSDMDRKVDRSAPR